MTRESVSGRRRQGRPYCKMATPQQKAFCILQFAKTNSVTTVQQLGVCQGRRLRTTPVEWSSTIETAHHRRCGNHKQGHERVWMGLTCVVWHGVPTLSVCKVTYENFESFPNYWCISRDCRLTGYFIMNTWKCCVLFEVPCTLRSTAALLMRRVL
jgi:hypothetical protein